MASLSQCLCGQSWISLRPSALPISSRNCNAKLIGHLSPITRHSLSRTLRPVSRPLCPVSWWQEDGSSIPNRPKEKWKFFWCTRRDPAASITDSENLSQDPNKAGSVSSHFNWKWIQKLKKVDLPDSILGFPKRDETWTVPWTGQTIFQVMFLWFFAFWLVGSWIMPFLAHAAGFTNENMTYRGQALYSLLTDIAEGTVGLAILYRCLARFHPLPNKWFHISWKGNWHIDTCLGCLMFPLVHRLSQINLDLLPVPSPFTATHVEQSILARDPVAMLLYAIVVSICAPIWEEVIFRGFLLPSLTRYMPIWSSILVSAIAFALAHFSVQRVLPLTFLGLVMGIVFVRSRNLLASMLLHCFCTFTQPSCINALA
uniref:CAAX prenyl protease 2/Lysostaphin resistance protein A-like domain-containing protein n=1 Tax=Araucaria cunninghamii TaxID=56994 RepID=A0A0D6R4P2_ARACU